VLRTHGQGGVVAGKSISHHNRHSAWQRTELRRVYGDTGMMETDRATGAYGNPGWRRWIERRGECIRETQGYIACMASCISYHLISLYNELHTPSFASFDLTRSVPPFVDPRRCVDPHSRVVSYLLILFIRSSSQNRSVSRNPFGMP
jgi:hypothetical protein